jgi:VIT1/CCC1 family predicted Fe2+/Mn2+ transporter
LPSKYLSYADKTSEIAFAALMVIIINAYVALVDLKVGILYIVLFTIGACISWGTIDGLIYATSSSIVRNNTQNKLRKLKASLNAPPTVVIEKVKENLNYTFLETFDDKGKEEIAKSIIAHVQNSSLSQYKIITKDEAIGCLSIIAIYLTVGFSLALPYIILQNKIYSWLVSNSLGVALLFWYGAQLGRCVGKNRWLLGLLMALVSIVFLVLSYLISGYLR